MIDARYYFGEPVAGAKVKYAVYRGRYWFPLWYDPDEDAPQEGGDAEGNDYGDEQIADSEGVLDAEGKLTIDFPTTVSDHKTDYRYRVEARVTDAGKREITGRGSVIATYGSFVVNARPDRYFYQPGEQRGDHGGSPRLRHQAGAHARPRGTAPLELAAARECGVRLLRSADVGYGRRWHGHRADRRSRRRAASYRVRVTARTPEGRDVEQFTYLWVSGGGRERFRRGQSARPCRSFPIRRPIGPGETAQVLIVTGQGEHAGAGVDRRPRSAQHKLMRSADATAILEVPVTRAGRAGHLGLARNSCARA